MEVMLEMRQKKILHMYNSKNLIHIFTILECCEKCWIYSASYDNPQAFIFENEQRDFNATLLLDSPYYENLKYLKK